MWLSGFSVVCYLVALVKPAVFSRFTKGVPNRKKALEITSLMAIFFLILWFVSALTLNAGNQKEIERSNSNSQPVEMKKTYTSAERVACGYFSTLYADLKKGILTDAEVRERAKKVYDHAENSDLLKEPATNLLSAITQNDTEKAKIYFASMMVLCSNILD